MVLFICIEGKWKSCTSSAVMLSACEPTPSKLVCLSPACLNCPTTAVDLQMLLPYKKHPFPLIASLPAISSHTQITPWSSRFCSSKWPSLAARPSMAAGCAE